MMKKMHILLVLCLVVAGAVIVGGCLSADNDKDLNNVGMTSFKSEKELKNYLETGSTSGRSVYGSTNYAKSSGVAPEAAPEPMAMDAMTEDGGGNSGGVDYSKTNVQIANVDEADIVKTDGKIIYYTPGLYYPTNVTLHDDSKYPYYTYDTYQITLVINAMPAETASIISQIKETGGNLYLADDLLITIATGYNESKIIAYDISDPSNPKVMWEQSYEGYYVDSRLIEDKLYFVASEYGFGVFPMMYMGKELAYADCYYPYGPEIIRPAADITYYVTKLDVKTGDVDDTKAFISSYSTTIFVSGDNMYLTNYYYPDTQIMFLDFVESNGSNYLSSDTMKYVKKVMGYDLSTRIKYMAVSEAIGNYTSDLTEDEYTNFYDSFYKDYNAYSSALIIEAEKTTITKINLETFDVVSGVVPGRINGKFAMDEKDGYFRVISTVGDDYRTEESTLRSIVNILNAEMETVGTLDNIATGESIQTTRYIGNTLYLMTYTDGDPFLLIDLSNPESPAVLGEMKLQGTYSYIYPISDTLLVGFGYTGDWRDWRTKLSLYDVSDPANPVELDVFYFNADEYVSVYDYHGFTWNAAKNLMIVSGSDTAYVFEIKDGQIKLMKEDVHKDSYVVRSAYIDNYLYVFSNKEIHIYNMTNWQRVQVIPIEQPVYPDYGTIYPTHDEPIYGTHETPVYG
ncbi:beta-propeller domain-containing protein [Methanimicrococcus blatticola]|uniref:Inhibitor of cysteine peptidase n=2 Tax=Methanimicrococcus blatticola TaxID=91560 RepID=A0A484F6C9_9EURY|nr:beta-propeller domain-containing protein [Methanimicrococcus blatticola]TDQ70952.1 inhibitor of cysteine peptidase [Methanimicrococcus blatticola]